ncbi:MAG: hypothetical protein ACP5I9_00060 [Candidatus Kapaibacteriota bacterium]
MALQEIVKKILSKWVLFENLKNDKFFGKIALILIFTLPIFSLIWLFVLSPETKGTFLMNYYSVLFLSFILAFILNVFIIYTKDLVFFLKIFVILFLIYFGMSLSVAIVHPFVSIATQIFVALPFVYTLPRNKYFYLKTVIIALAVAQFPPFPFILSKEILILNIAVKLIFSFAIFWLFSLIPLSSMILNFLPFFAMVLNFVYSASIDFGNYLNNFKVLSATIWNVITIPIWLLLAGDFVDEIGRFGKIFSKYFFPFVKTKGIFLIEIFIVLFVFVTLGYLLFWKSDIVTALLANLKLPSFLSNYKEVLVISLRFVTPVVIIICIMVFLNLNRINTLELKARFNQILFAIVVFSVQIIYSYFFTTESEVGESLTGFPFLLLVLGFFWEPLKLVGTTEMKSENLSVLLAYILILTGMLVNINLVWEPVSVAQVSIVYQIIGGIAVGIPVLFLRLFVGWDFDEKFIFRNFLLGFAATLPPIVLLPNEFWISTPIGLAIALLIHKILIRAEITFWDYVTLGFGALSQTIIVWILPLPIIPLLQVWFANLGKIVPVEIFSFYYFKQIACLLASAIIYLIASHFRFSRIAAIPISLLSFVLLSYALLK